jgi:hypothetical protein
MSRTKPIARYIVLVSIISLALTLDCSMRLLRPVWSMTIGNVSRCSAGFLRQFNIQRSKLVHHGASHRLGSKVIWPICAN